MPTHSPKSTRARRAVVAVGLAALLSGCATTSSSGGSMIETGDVAPGSRTIDPAFVDGPTRDAGRDLPLAEYHRTAAQIAMRDGQTFGAAAHLSKLHEANPRDKQVAYDLARHLRYLGATADAERVLNAALAIHPNDPLLQLELGKMRIAAGDADGALAALEPLRRERPRDPAILQAIGVALDRKGDHAAAQAVYAEAIASGRPSAALLNNAGLSHMISGDLDAAEALLRRAQTAPGATPQVTQNLALALSLKGQEAEARRLAETALPANVAQASVDYYSTIADSRDAWSLASGD